MPHGSDCLFSLIRRPHFVSFTRALGIASQQPGGPVSRPSFASSPRPKVHVSIHTISLHQASLACHAADEVVLWLLWVQAWEWLHKGIGYASLGLGVWAVYTGLQRTHVCHLPRCPTLPPAAMSHTAGCSWLCGCTAMVFGRTPSLLAVLLPSSAHPVRKEAALHSLPTMLFPLLGP